MWERWPGTVLVKPFGVGVYGQGSVRRSFLLRARSDPQGEFQEETALIRFSERAKAFDQGFARAPA